MNSFVNVLGEVSASRSFNAMYILLDCIFLVVIITLLVLKKKYVTLIWCLCGGLLYLAVDFGIFYCATHTRVITINGTTLDALGHFLVLFWFSFSYAIPNFLYIWLAFRKDKHFWLFTALIIGWWFIVPQLSKVGDLFTGAWPSYVITTSRTTGNFHWVMSAFLIVGYGSFIIWSFFRGDLKKNLKILLLLNVIGITTQLMWEVPLLVNGIRPLNETSFQVLIMNSLIETNSGMVYFMLIFNFVAARRNEDFSIPSPDECNRVFKIDNRKKEEVIPANK